MYYGLFWRIAGSGQDYNDYSDGKYGYSNFGDGPDENDGAPTSLTGDPSNISSTGAGGQGGSSKYEVRVF